MKKHSQRGARDGRMDENKEEKQKAKGAPERTGWQRGIVG
jgi:hypothetical protein